MISNIFTWSAVICLEIAKIMDHDWGIFIRILLLLFSNVSLHYLRSSFIPIFLLLTFEAFFDFDYVAPNVQPRLVTLWKPWDVLFGHLMV